MSTAARQAVLILGMHRSGTSAMAGISHMLGAAAPAAMMEEASDNPTGFWESFPVAALNEAIFKGLGGHWFDCLGCDVATLDAAARAQLADQCAQVLAADFGDAPIFVLKDPRLSVLLELWLPVFASMNLRVAPILALRHPTEATSSLRRRDGMPAEIAAPLWLHYSLESERLTRGRPRAFLSYDRLLQDWRAAFARVTQIIGIDWPLSFEAAGATIDDFLRPQMRHHHVAPNKVVVGRPPVAGWIAETFAALRAIEDGNETGSHAILDRVRAAFAEWRRDAPHITMEMAAGREPPPRRG